MNEFADIKAGDKVVRLYGKYESEGWALETVTRTTATRVIITVYGKEKAFQRSHGREIGGDDWHPEHLYPATPEFIKRVEDHQRQRAERLARTRISDAVKTLPLETLQAIERVITKPQKAAHA